MAETGSSIREVRWLGPDDETVVAAATGDIDMRHSAAFQGELLALLARHPRRFVVDLSDVPYMDSSGVASLVKLLSRCSREKVALKLAGMAPRVRGVFEVTKLDIVFDITATVDEAIAS